MRSRVQVMTRDLARFKADLQQVPALKAEIETMRQELQRVRYMFTFSYFSVEWRLLLSMRRKDMRRTMIMV
ncbi:hypothetical protein Tsubulata_038916 [Turnera subulata]|uniref:Uncharacterized protein n=1 Tax=Turnera subulata TaxID=218843 RepID=A0A9Q0G8K1_9ROSI|nr:hypothetical protein Tsubulata_038916 [Turnera subulata]